ncbi:MAG: PLP-dependent lyase/thiolase [Ilumatobacteraceae bacterium]|nr:PLP-dependent lyase/thiolase [Ilumatobacteraceae bacterium]
MIATGAAGWSCAVCGTHVDIAAPLVWRCPRASGSDPHHALQLVQGIAPLRGIEDTNPFIAFQPYLAWDSFAAANGMTEAARAALIRQLDVDIAGVAGTGFHVTPFDRADALSDALGFTEDGGVWVKDETGNVAGSHKARHLMTILLHLVTVESLGLAPWTNAADRPTLAIASCGNAAFAAATLAAAVKWPLRVFVPPHADPAVIAGLRQLGADIVECPRRDGDPPGDPCMHRFREAVATGAIPFTVQGTENVWCLDGGRTIGWEMAWHLEENVVGPPLDRLFVQVGAGALAASAINGFRMSGVTPRLHAVQTDGCAPLQRAYANVEAIGGPKEAAGHWSDCMWPWEHVGNSAADGILDDETYDWIPVVRAMDEANGGPIVVTEAQVREANDLGRATTGIDASHTGTAGLAGLLAARDTIDPGERVAVIFSGVSRA